MCLLKRISSFTTATLPLAAAMWAHVMPFWKQRSRGQNKTQSEDKLHDPVSAGTFYTGIHLHLLIIKKLCFWISYFFCHWYFLIWTIYVTLEYIVDELKCLIYTNIFLIKLFPLCGTNNVSYLCPWCIYRVKHVQSHLLPTLSDIESIHTWRCYTLFSSQFGQNNKRVAYTISTSHNRICLRCIDQRSVLTPNACSKDGWELKMASSLREGMGMLYRLALSRNSQCSVSQ